MNYFSAATAFMFCDAEHSDILKLVSAIFYQIFISHQMMALKKLWKMLFFFI